MRHSILLILPFLMVLTNSCGLLDKSQEENIIGKYFIGWVEGPTDRCIFIKESEFANARQILVSGKVISIGNNERFIWAKSFPNPNFKEIIRYHIIDTTKDRDNVKTFETENDFISSLISLGINEINYDKNYYFAP